MIASLSPAHVGRDRARRNRKYQNACGYQGEDSQNSDNRSVSKFTFEFPILGENAFFDSLVQSYNGPSGALGKG